MIFRAAAKAVSAIIRERVVPTAIEFMDNPAIRLAERYLNKKVVFDNAAAHSFELDGNRKEEFRALDGSGGEIFERFRGLGPPRCEGAGSAG